MRGVVVQANAAPDEPRGQAMTLTSFLFRLGKETGTNCSVGRVRGLVTRFLDEHDDMRIDVLLPPFREDCVCVVATDGTLESRGCGPCSSARLQAIEEA